MPDFHEVRFKCEEVRMRQGKIIRPTFPVDDPIRPRPPAVAVDKEGKVGIMQEKFAIEPLY